MTNQSAYDSGVATTDATRRFGTTDGTPASALASASNAPEADAWDEAIDRLLTWLRHPASLHDDRPLPSVLTTAIDFACDVRSDNWPAPDTIAPVDGDVSFHWGPGNRTLIIDIDGEGTAAFTELLSGRIINRGRLSRNPRTRRLERDAERLT